MDTAHLIQMASQILKNFAVHGDEAAATSTARHIREFWEPRMIDAIVGSQADAELQIFQVVKLLKAGKSRAHIAPYVD